METKFKVFSSRRRGRCLVTVRELRANDVLLSENPALFLRLPLNDGLLPHETAVLNRAKQFRKDFKGHSFVLATRAIIYMWQSKEFAQKISKLYHPFLEEDDEAISAGVDVVQAMLRGYCTTQCTAHSLDVRKFENFFAPSHEICKKVLLQLKCNVFHAQTDAGVQIGLGLYFTAANANHDCCPNCWQKFDCSTGKIEFIAQRPIRVGEELTVSYVNAGSFRTVMHRRVELLASFNFCCACFSCTKQWRELSLAALKQRQHPHLLRELLYRSWKVGVTGQTMRELAGAVNVEFEDLVKTTRLLDGKAVDEWLALRSRLIDIAVSLISKV